MLRYIVKKSGVLEPEELSSMMENNHKSGKKALPTILEDIDRSTESISTFQSDCTVENSQEFVLFEDVRASIQRSAKTSDAATPGKNNELRATEVAMTPSESSLFFQLRRGSGTRFACLSSYMPLPPSYL